MTDGDIEFWPIQRVVDAVGLSRSAIYRRIKEATFPAPRPYRNSARVFWLSSDVRRWQQDELGFIVDGLVG